ncbi:MAG: CPBP family intramembrane metalloprotease [Gemmatimonadetes bacterium]|nr:CPBP family intramembrane metalloprotease [Gemmatimonadota bacterium]
MFSARSEQAAPVRPWQSKAAVQLWAIVLGVLPLYATLVILQSRSDQPISMRGFALYLAVIAPLGMVIALLLLRSLCGEQVRDLNLKPGRLTSDVLAALVLAVVIIVANVVSTGLLSELLPESPANTAVINLMRELASNPRLLVLFLGLLLLLGAASEEVIRVFLLTRLWKLWGSTAGRLAGVAISAGLFGLIHSYQGPVGIGWTAIFGLIAGLYYLRYGRVVPLVLAHYAPNALQVVAFAALRQ